MSSSMTMSPESPYDQSTAVEMMMLLHYEVFRVDPEVQQRQELSEATIGEYADLLKEGHALGRIVVFHDPVNGYWLADGFHRVEAARRIGLEELPAVSYTGNKRDAILYACGANKHGLPRKPAEKRHSVLYLLQDDEWKQWSDSAIAQHCGVTQPFVSKLRRTLKTVISENQPRTYTTRHGTVTTMDTSKIGRRASNLPATAVASTTLPEALTEPEAVGAQPVVLASGSSLLVHAPAPAAVGAVPVVLEDSNAPPADQPVPVWDLAELVQEATLSLDEIRSQLGMLEEDYRSFTTSEGQPFPSAWAFITAPEPEGRGCDLRALLASTAPLVTQLEQLQAAAVAPPVEQMTNVQRVLQVISELPVKFSPSHAAVRTGLTTDQARRTLRSLVENGALSKDEDGGYSKRRRTSSKNSARR